MVDSVEQFKISDIPIESVNDFFDSRLIELSFDLGKKLNKDILEHTVPKLATYFYEKYPFKKLDEMVEFLNMISTKELKIYSICFSDIVDAYKEYLQKKAEISSKIKQTEKKKNWDSKENAEKVRISLEKGIADDTATYSIEELRKLDPDWVNNVWEPSKKRSAMNFKKRQNCT